MSITSTSPTNSYGNYHDLYPRDPLAKRGDDEGAEAESGSEGSECSDHSSGFERMRESHSPYAMHNWLRAGGNRERRDAEGNTPLMMAARWGDLEAVRAIFTVNAAEDSTSEGSSVNSDNYEARAWRRGVEHVDPEVEVDATNDAGKTAIMLACEHGHVEVVKFLLEHDASLDSSAFITAAEKEDEEMIEFLAEQGHASVDGEEGTEALISAARAGKAQTLRYLLPRVEEERGSDSALMKLICASETDVVRTLLEAGSAVGEALHKQKNRAGDTGLHIAVRMGNRDMAGLLLEYDADPEAKNSAGECVLDLVRAVGNREMRELFEDSL